MPALFHVLPLAGLLVILPSHCSVPEVFVILPDVSQEQDTKNLV